MIKGGNMLVYAAGFPAIFGRQMPYFLDPVFVARSEVDPPATSDVLHEKTTVEVEISLSAAQDTEPTEAAGEGQDKKTTPEN